MVGRVVPLALMAACGPSELVAVGGPGGVYRPDAGCALAEAAPDCARPDGGGAAPALRFESSGDPGLVIETPDTLSGLGVACQRTYCGTGALTAQASFQWDEAIPQDPRRMGSLTHVFDPPVDLLGRTVTFAVSYEGPKVPMHAQVGIVSDYWHWVAWAPLPAGWTRISGVVSPDNPLTELDPAATAVMVRELRIDVYVPEADASGATGTWAGSIYVDDVGWQ